MPPELVIQEDETQLIQPDDYRRNALLHSVSEYHSKHITAIKKLQNCFVNGSSRKRPYSKAEDTRIA